MGLLEQTIQPHCRWKPNAEGLLSSAATRADGYQHGVRRQMASGERRRSSQSHEVVWWRRMTARNTRWARVSPGADGEETVEFSQQEKYRIRGWEKSRRQGKKKKAGPWEQGRVGLGIPWKVGVSSRKWFRLFSERSTKRDKNGHFYDLEVQCSTGPAMA